MTPSRHDSIVARLKVVWWRGQVLHAAAGLLLFCRWIIPLVLAGMAVDWLTDLPPLGRVAFLVMVLAFSAYKAWRGGWRQIRAFRATHTALQVEKHLGGLESLLVSAVQLGAAGSQDGTSPSLRDVTLRRAEEIAGRLRAKEIVGFRGLRLPAVAALLLALMLGGLALVSGPLLFAGATRMFIPWLSVEYPTYTRLHLAVGDMVVKEGDPARIVARVSGVIPRRAKLALRTGTGTSRLHPMEIADGRCEYVMESVFRGFEYRIVAGDARSPWHKVLVIPPPRIEHAEVCLDFPAYTRRPAETGEALTFVVPENTVVRWRLTLDRAVSKAQFVVGDQETLPLEVSPDGRVVTISRVATDSRAYRFSWVESEHGFFFTSPRYFVQVSPDQRPSVELTSPRADLYATLGRKLDLAFRGRDDYGIGEAVISYHVNKNGEVKTPLPPPAVHDGSEQYIDWDYRSALPDLAVGDTLTFALELADRYPGPAGPQRARSEARRMTFLSKEQYLEQIAKQKQRLLTRLQSTYREERAVHDLVRRFDPLDDGFIQTCQLEAVRQDLMRERLGLLAREMNALVEDMAANNITEDAHSAALSRLASAIQTIADEHVGGAASDLRSLASASGRGRAGIAPDPGSAVMKVNTAARELGLLVLELGYKDAADVMARELHATAQTLASMRLKTILPGQTPSTATQSVAGEQERLEQWLTRLLAATPREQETTVADSLSAFNLTRLAKNLRSDGVQTKMSQAVALIRSEAADDAARLQAEVIQALLRAEFRLRFGSEYEALRKARELFVTQAQSVKSLRVEIADLSAEELKSRQSGIARTQAAFQKELLLLLMPAIPAPRQRLLDDLPPPAPPVDVLLAAARSAMKKSAAHIEAADRDAVVGEQRKVEESLLSLEEIVRARMESMAQIQRMTSFLDSCANEVTKFGQFIERQLSLLEKTGDVAGDRAESTFLAGPQQKLLDDITMFRSDVIDKSVELGMRREDLLPLQSGLDRVVRSMTDAAASLRGNQSAKAGDQQKTAIVAMKEVETLLADDVTRVTAYVKVFVDNEAALAPGPYIAEIEAEQRDLIAATRKAQPADFPGLVMPQKNLVHAVNAVLTALDVLAHKVESGTEMLFAKTDMDSAAAALEGKDLSEAIDAQTAVADSVHDLRVRLQAVTPQYGYILDITECVHDILPEAVSLRAAQSELRGKTLAATEGVSLGTIAVEQRSLASRVKSIADRTHKATGQAKFQTVAQYMTEAADRLDAGDKTAAALLMQTAEERLVADSDELLVLMKHLAVVLSPPLPTREPSPQVKLLLDVLPLAARQRELCLQTQTAAPEQATSLAAEQRAFQKQCEALLSPSMSHPKLVETVQYMTAAAVNLESASRVEAVGRQRQAGEALRHFIIEYIIKYVELPGNSSPQPPAPNDEPGDETDISLFMPGAVSGKIPKSGRAEWEVLGRRERAALNENFARELPLEYRAILKDYYERLTR